MTALAVQALMWLLSAVGLKGKVSEFAAGAIVAGLMAIAFAAYSGYLVHLGYQMADNKAQVEALEKENANLAAALIEKRKQVVLLNASQDRDGARLMESDALNRKLQEEINATPVNSSRSLDRAAINRVRNVK